MCLYVYVRTCTYARARRTTNVSIRLFVSLLAYREKRNNKTPQAGYVELSRHDIPIHYLVDEAGNTFYSTFFLLFFPLLFFLETATSSSRCQADRNDAVNVVARHFYILLGRYVWYVRMYT